MLYIQMASIYNSRNYRSLLAPARGVSKSDIYNSRNYRSLLASHITKRSVRISTIVEIIEAYQPVSRQAANAISTIVEIIEAYQPRSKANQLLKYLQQQKLQKLTSREIFSSALLVSIYNSRNYRSLLAPYRLQRYKKSLKQRLFCLNILEILSTPPIKV